MVLLNRIIKKTNKTIITIEDLTYLNELLESNLPIKTCLNLLMNKSNKDGFSSLISELEKGRLIDEIIVEYLPKDLALYMNNLLQNLSFKESLRLALAFYYKNRENKKALNKAIAYPLILLFISLTGLYLFDSYGLDSILNLMKDFGVNISSFYFVRILIKVIIYIFYFGFIIIACLLLYFLKPKRIVLFYILLSKYYPNSLFHTYCTEEFVSLLVVTVKLGYKTKETLNLLKAIKAKPIISFLAFHLDDQLLEGNTLIDASKLVYFDESFAKYIKVASYTTNFAGVMENYVTLASNKLKNKMKLYANILQASSYVMIAVIIVFIYQVLFLPMKMITSF